MGSSGACARNGTSYTASMRFAAPASAASGSPSCRATSPGSRLFASNSCRIAALDSCACGPGSQTTSSASRPRIAAHVEVATTATPEGISTTFRTPGTVSERAPSYRCSVPPKTSHRATTATTVSGGRVSMPNRARPTTFSGVSSRGTLVPMKRKSLGSLRRGSSGIGRRAAASASAPYSSRRLVGTCKTAPFSARQADGSIPQRAAAAATNISRAVAPALRRRSHEPRTLLLPPVVMLPYSGAASACSTRIRDQSASSSSATSMTMAVRAPCPSSERATVIVTVPSVSMRSQMFGLNAAVSTGSSARRSLANGKRMASTNPPVAAPTTSMN
jgi:hypothetical protein